MKMPFARFLVTVFTLIFLAAGMLPAARALAVESIAINSFNVSSVLRADGRCDVTVDWKITNTGAAATTAPLDVQVYNSTADQVIDTTPVPAGTLAAGGMLTGVSMHTLPNGTLLFLRVKQDTQFINSVGPEKVLCVPSVGGIEIPFGDSDFAVGQSASSGGSSAPLYAALAGAAASAVALAAGAWYARRRWLR